MKKSKEAKEKEEKEKQEKIDKIRYEVFKEMMDRSRETSPYRLHEVELVTHLTNSKVL